MAGNFRKNWWEFSMYFGRVICLKIGQIFDILLINATLEDTPSQSE
jgi:hypothetical protein